MALKSVGSQWLKEHYNLAGYLLTHSSYIGSGESIELTSKGNVEQVYGPKYNVTDPDDPVHHLEFSLKYDDLNLDFLKAIFEKMDQQHIEAFIESAPAGKYARKIGFLYEFLTGRQIKLTKGVSGNHSDLLDEDKYIAGHIKKNARWRINNNLLGNHGFCPVIRKTNELKELLTENIPEKIQKLKEGYSPEIFRRAINYLYKKETKSSYEIEREKPSPDRLERFIALLSKAGTETTEEMLSKKRLIQLQNAIVDPRFAAKDFRLAQSYVGETLPNFDENIHYICPPPSFVESLMSGLHETALKTQAIHPGVRAALISFGFVFIHPFDDGNGRLHRFLIHDFLVHDKIVPQGLIIPVSAHMLNHIKEYDNALEKYSKPLLQRVKYNKQDNEEIVVTNAAEIEGYFRYPDLTDHSVYLIQTILATIAEDMPGELLFIQRYDEAKRELQAIVDMPDKLINTLLIFLHQNQGVFPKRRREYFNQLTDDEIERMQQAYRTVFDLKEIQ